MKIIKNKIISSLFLFIFLVSCSSSELNETTIINTPNKDIVLEKSQVEKPTIPPLTETNHTKDKENIAVSSSDSSKDIVTEVESKTETKDTTHKDKESEIITDKGDKVEKDLEEQLIDNSFFTDKVDSLFSKVGLNSSHYGIKVVNLTTNKTVFEKNGDTSFVPASNTKLYTAGAAINVLGEDYKFKTRLAYTGTISSDGILDGDLYIIGGGDPTLGSKYMYNRQFYMKGRATPSRIATQLSFLDSWTDEVKKLGINNITGKILVDNSHFNKIIPAINTWEWGDMSTSFGAAPSGVNVLDNTALLEFTRGENTTITPSSSTINVDNETIDGNRNKVVISAPAYSNSIVALGEVNTSVFKEVPVSNPGLLLADLFKDNLNKNGISSNGEVEVVKSSSNSKVFYTHYSPRVDRIITLMNSYSINLFAEVLKLETEKVLAKNRPISISRYWYETLKLQGFIIYDGSGLSRYNRVTPDNITDLLTYMHLSEKGDTYYNSLAIAGNLGTLEDFNKAPLKSNLHAKSGTLTGIKSYSGYITNSNGDLLAFSLMVNLHGLTNSQITSDLEKLMSEMYKLQ